MRFAYRPSSLRAAFHALLMAAALLGTPSAASASIAAIPGLDRAMLSPAFWIARQPAADAVVLDAAQIEALNGRMRREDASIHAPLELPDHLDWQTVRSWIEAVSN